jgi:hypothetical protein
MRDERPEILEGGGGRVEYDIGAASALGAAFLLITSRVESGSRGGDQLHGQ